MMKDDIRVTRAIFERYWRDANDERLRMLTDGETRRLTEYHWALLLAARIDEESDKLLEK
jgi:hypothetical protein